MVDYPGFNLRIADFLKENNIKVFYYISPQVWAWKQSRVKKIKKVVDRMFVILPFEKPFYEKFDYKVDFLGHPLLDEVERFKKSSLTAQEFKKQNNLSEKKIIALLPGSRTQEIKKKLPIMLSVVKSYPQYQFVIAGAPSQEETFYNELAQGYNVPVIHGKTYNLLNNSYAALVTSGTATLETALFRVPQVVCYKGSAISYQIAKRLIKVDYISLVNLILNKEAVKELIQAELNTENLSNELTAIIEGGSKREKVLQDYDELINILGGAGASGKVADLMLTYLKA